MFVLVHTRPSPLIGPNRRKPSSTFRRVDWSLERHFLSIATNRIPQSAISIPFETVTTKKHKCATLNPRYKTIFVRNRHKASSYFHIRFNSFRPTRFCGRQLFPVFFARSVFAHRSMYGHVLFRLPRRRSEYDSTTTVPRITITID